jgi:hypothetical protein
MEEQIISLGNFLLANGFKCDRKNNFFRYTKLNYVLYRSATNKFAIFDKSDTYIESGEYNISNFKEVLKCKKFSKLFRNYKIKNICY